MEERSLRWERRFEWPMVVAALLVVPLLVIEESDLGEPWATVGVVLNWGTWAAFATEFVVMMVVTPRRFEWIKRHPIDAVVVFLTPPFLPANLAAARLFRLLRLLRLARLFTLRDLLSLEGIRYAAFVALFTVIVGGAGFAAIEKETDEGPLTAWDGIWWAVTTVTTVGYGDISPSTDAGRIIAATIMLVGIGFVALLTAFVADRFIRKETEDAVSEHEVHILAELRRTNERLAAIERRLDR